MVHCIAHRFIAPLAASLIIASGAFAQDKTPVDLSKYEGKAKLACVGDSITEGVGAARGQSWPAQIQAMLGDQWEVGNFGLSATTLMNSGNKPYQTSPPFEKALAFAPDVVVIMLGTNDTKARNWQHFEKDFEKDYRDLIADFAGLESKPRIFLCLPPYIAGDGRFGINNANTEAQIPVVTAVAKDLKLGLINVYGALKDKDDLIPDKVHPNTEGATKIAEAVFKALTGKEAPVPVTAE